MPTRLCLFSDGVRFRVGWWSRSEGALFIPNSDGERGPADSNFRPTCWARLPDLVKEWKADVGNLIGC